VDRDTLPHAPQLQGQGSQRQPELDALRGLMLTLMTLAHLPTQAHVLTNQQLGFVTEAEGFVFLSAFLTGRIFGRMANEFPFRTVIKRLWTRALRLYGYHLFLLGIAFTAVATVAVHTKRPGLEGLLDFYLAHPLHAVGSAVLLVYCPPLLDIMPMYIMFFDRHTRCAICGQALELEAGPHSERPGLASRTVWPKIGDVRADGQVSRVADTFERVGCI
jgi:hypothetical protein